MKKSITLIVALAMILGMSQCKKKIETVTANEMDGGVFITLDLNGGEKHIVNPATGTVDYTDGDVIYVGNDGKYCGALIRTSGQFSGTIYPTSTDDYLHFYFFGGRESDYYYDANNFQSFRVGQTTEYIVDIKNQSVNLPVLSYGKSTILYTEGVTAYESFLLNKCALVEFKLNEGTDEYVRVAELPTVATISFANPDNPIAATGTTGVITLYSKSATSKWAILLPTSSATNATATILCDDYDITVPALNNNGYITGSSAIAIANTAAPPTVDGVFSVSPTKTVHFSPGNLEYRAGEGWRFESRHNPEGTEWTYSFDNVWCHGYKYSCGELLPSEWFASAWGGNYTWATTWWVSMFGWGTWSGTPEQWNPLNASTNENDYTWNGDKYFQGTIDGHNDWYTLSRDEWDYLLYGRTNAANLYGFYRIEDRSSLYGLGMVLLPDNWTLPDGVSFNPGETQLTTIDVCTWALMEANGAVFLGGVGYREGMSNHLGNLPGVYWCSDYFEYEDEPGIIYPHTLEINGAGHRMELTYEDEAWWTPEYGFYVRLVR